jgi:two-component system sensor histidine kinase SenX3
MRVASRQKAVAFFVVLGSCLVALAVALNISWVILNWREGVLLLFGVIFFGLIIAGMILNTLFLVREIRRNEQHDSFINAVTHELKTPIASIRLYLETLQRRDVTEKQRREFYELMLLDTDRLMGTVKQVLKAGEVGYKHVVRERVELDFPELVSQSMELARTRHHLPPGNPFGSPGTRKSCAPRSTIFLITPSSIRERRWTSPWASIRRTTRPWLCGCATAAWVFRRTL